MRMWYRSVDQFHETLGWVHAVNVPAVNFEATRVTSGTFAQCANDFEEWYFGWQAARPHGSSASCIGSLTRLHGRQPMLPHG